MADDLHTRKRPSPWVPHRPEERFSIYVDRLFTRALLPPHYVTAQHDADEGQRTDNQRARARTRGVKPGALDWDVVQGPPVVARKLELKRGRNPLSDNQQVSIAKLTACGAAPIVAYDLRQVHAGMVREGFRFAENVQFVLAELELHLAAADRAALAVKAGLVVRKKSKPKKREPRYTFGKRAVARANKAGILF